MIFVAAVYSAAGIAYNKRLNNLEGVEAFPNIDFWREFPGLVSDGASFLWGKIRGQAARSTSEDYPGL